MGLLAREIERRGVTTVCLGLVRELAVSFRAPRMLYLHWPFGHALGEPGDVAQQRTVLHDMLSLAAMAPRPGLVVDLPYRWRRETYAAITDWNAPSESSSVRARKLPAALFMRTSRGPSVQMAAIISSTAAASRMSQRRK